MNKGEIDMIGFDTNKPYVLLEYQMFQGLGLQVPITFGNTKEELEFYCKATDRTLVDNYFSEGGQCLIMLTKDYVTIIDKTVYKEITKYTLKSNETTIQNQPNNDTVIGTTNLEVGDEFEVSHDVYGEIPFIVIGKNHDGDNTITIMSKYILELLPFDAAEPSNIDEGRRKSGNNNYKHSNLLQWLNSTDKDRWYHQQHRYDSAPDRCVNNRKSVCTSNPYSIRDGFLCGFNEDFLSQLVTVPKRTVEPDYDWVGSTISYHKVFLLSSTEVGLGNVNGVLEGETYEYFKIKTGDEYERRLAYPSTYCLNHSDIGSFNVKEGCSWMYWLRTPCPHLTEHTRIVDVDGTIEAHYPCLGKVGVRPVMVLSHVHI